jgi:hypothetical protein
MFAIVLRDGDRMIGTRGLHELDFRSRRAASGSTTTVYTRLRGHRR